MVESGEMAEEAASAFDVFMHDLSEKVPAAGVSLATLLHKLYEGEYEESIALLAQEKDQTATCGCADEASLGKLGKEIAELLRILVGSENVISTKAGAPQAGLRELARRAPGDGDVDEESAMKERDLLWQKAIAQRKKAIAHCPNLAW